MKKIPKLSKSLKISIITGAVVSALSLLIKLVPCKILTKANSSWGLCNVPITDLGQTDLNNLFFNITNNPIPGLLLQFIIFTIIVYLLMVFIKVKPKKNRVLDLTRK